MRDVRKTKLNLEALEGRDVPAAYAFANGVFTINLAEITDRSVTVDSTSTGVVALNGQGSGGAGRVVVGAPGGQLRAEAVTQIVVNGTDRDDSINLAGVDTREFRNLSGRVDITGGSGRDTIYGTAFDDRIRAGEDNDRVFGLGGNDRIWGDGGDDNLWGDGDSSRWDWLGGNDRIDGGSGNDYLFGCGGDDLLIGRDGNDYFDGGVGADVAWVDGLDRRLRYGWRGVESVRTGTPPAV